MEYSCVRQTLIPGTSSLFLDYLYNFDRVERFYSHNPFDPGSFRIAAEEIRYPDSRRAQLVEALAKNNPDSLNLRRLGQPGTVAVVTGQQVGFLSGPAYTIYKAVTAARLAKRLTDQGIPAVPVFWLATEDHDVAEVNHAWVFDHTLHPRRLAAEKMESSGGPVGRAVLHDLPFAELKRSLAELPYAKDVLVKLEYAYSPGETLGCAFQKFLSAILKPLDLVYLDPLQPEIREAASGLLIEAAEHVHDLRGALRERDQELAGAEYHSQVHLEKESSLLFLLDRGRRVPLKTANGGFSVRERSLTLADLKNRSRDLSPNALLRPVVQDYLLPTVAYVGGPAELAYFAQAQVLYRQLLGRMPVMFPRNGFTLLDRRAEKLLARYGLRFTDVLNSEEQVRQQIAERLVSAETRVRIEAARGKVRELMNAFSADLARLDPTLEAAATKSKAKMLYQVERLSQKAARESLRRNYRASEEADHLIHLIYPHRHLQERFYSIVPFLAKFGLELPQFLMEEAQLDCPDHMVRVVA